MNYLTRVYTMICGKETDNVDEEEDDNENYINEEKEDWKGENKNENDINEEKEDDKECEEGMVYCGCFSSLTSRKKTFAYKKNKPVISSNEICKNNQLQKYIRSLPDELKLYILSYTQQPQPPALLKDIQNFHLTFRFLLNVICKKNPRKIISRILMFYDSSILYNNINHIIARKIKKWQINHRNTKVIDDFIIIEYPTILKLFNKDNKYTLLWGILPPVYRNKYLNFLYSVMSIETDEEDQGGDTDTDTAPTPDTDTDTDTDFDAYTDAAPTPDTDTDTDFDAYTDAAPRCSVYFA